MGPYGAHAEPRHIVQSGHSLTDNIMEPLSELIRSAGPRGGSLVKSTIPGSPMDWRWKNAAQPDIRDPAVMARFDTLVITERVSLSGTVPYHDSPRWAAHWCDHAWTHGAAGNGTTCTLYATWVNIDSGPDFENPWNDDEGHIPFRDRLPLEQARWVRIHEAMNAARPAGAPEVAMIPGPRIMAMVHDAIAAGDAPPGLSSFADLFRDTIHLNRKGGYLIALAHYAVLFDADPRGLPRVGSGRDAPTAEQAAWMQDIVWRALSAPVDAAFR